MRSGSISSNSRILAIIVAALGYFVDVFDIWLFSSVRTASLQGLGYRGAELKSVGEALLNWQMGGFIIGAILFGMVADRRGRLAVLFGSIFTYSIANIVNGFAVDYWTYAGCRFVAGIGLAGELGAGIALVSELVSTKNRGWATTFVATVGVTGSVAAPLVASAVHWRTAYWIGGGMGIILLLMRIGVFESGLFEEMKSRPEVRRGDFKHLFETWERVKRYFATILCGAPVWFFAGLMMTFSPEIQTALGIQNPKPAPTIIAVSALGLCIGDVVFGALSQLLKSRRKAFWVAYGWMAIAIAFILVGVKNADSFFWWMFVAGIGAGYWAVFVTTAGETFGTNLRGTVATTAPSFVRGLVIPMTLASRALVPQFGPIGSVAILGCVVLLLAAWSVYTLPETFHRNLDFVES